jgi:hypothetical protein
MATINWLSRYVEDLVKDAKLIKQSGMKCTEVLECPLVETATGKVVHMCYKLKFEGNFFQYLKAMRIIDSLHKR